MHHTAGGIHFQLYDLARKGSPRVLICYLRGSTRERRTFRGELGVSQQ